MKNKIITLAMAAAVLALPSCNKEDAAMDNATETPTSETTRVSNSDLFDWEAMAEFLTEEELAAIKKEVAWLDAPKTRGGLETIEAIEWDFDDPDQTNIIEPKGIDVFSLFIDGDFNWIEVKAEWDGTEVVYFPISQAGFVDIDKEKFEAFYSPTNQRRTISWSLRTNQDGDFQIFQVWFQKPYYVSLENTLSSGLNYMIPNGGGKFNVSLPDKNTGSLIPQPNQGTIELRVVKDDGTEETLHDEGNPNAIGGTYGVATTLEVGPMDPKETGNVNVRLEYRYAHVGLGDNESIKEYFGDDDWYLLEKGVQRYTEDLVAFESRYYVTPEISAAGNKVRVHMNKVAGSVFDLSKVQFRGKITWHRNYEEAQWPALEAGVVGYGVEDPLNDKYKGYVDLTFPAVVNSGWVHQIMGCISHIYNLGAASWSIQYRESDQHEWKELGKNYQRAYYLDVANPKNTKIAAEGGSWQINVGGYFETEEVLFRACLADGTPVSNPNGVPSTGPTNSSSRTSRAYIDVYENNGAAPREVYLAYSLDEGDNWDIWDESNTYARDWETNDTASKTGENYPVIQPNVIP